MFILIHIYLSERAARVGIRAHQAHRLAKQRFACLVGIFRRLLLRVPLITDLYVLIWHYLANCVM